MLSPNPFFCPCVCLVALSKGGKLSRPQTGTADWENNPRERERDIFGKQKGENSVSLARARSATKGKLKYLPFPPLFFSPGWKSTINQSHLRYKQQGKTDRSWREKEQKREGKNLLSVKPCLVNSRLEVDGTEKKNLFLSNFLVLPLFTSFCLAQPSEFSVSKSEMFSSVGPPESRESERQLQIVQD